MRPPFLPGRRSLRLLIAAGIALGLGFFALFPETTSLGWSPLPLCAFKGATGLPCVLCGGTRSARALLHGDMHRALSLNALAIPAVLGAATLVIVLLGEAIIGRPFCDWAAMAKKFRPLLLWVIIFLAGWWAFQLWGAFAGPKQELLDLQHPMARFLNDLIHNHSR